LSSETTPGCLRRIAFAHPPSALYPLVLLIVFLPQSAFAQRVAVPDDFLGLTHCDSGRAVTRMRADIRDTLLRAQLEAHEAVHRAQANKFTTCEAFTASLATARHIIDAELPAYCAQWRVAVAQGVDTMDLRRDYAWRIAAQSGAMENRLQVLQRFKLECPGAGR
jgi:hypothetical protein